MIYNSSTSEQLPDHRAPELAWANDIITVAIITLAMITTANITIAISTLAIITTAIITITISNLHFTISLISLNIKGNPLL